MTDGGDDDGVLDPSRVRVRVTARTAMALWPFWADIAVTNRLNAAEARRQLHIVAEFRAALVGIAACAHALDAMYGQLINDDVRAHAPGWRASRHANIRACLCRRFKIDNATGRRWRREFSWLFGQRDAAVHAEYEMRVMIPHPSGGDLHASPLFTDYSLERLDRGVGLLLDVLAVCAANPRDADAAEFTPRYRELHAQLLSRLGGRWPDPA